MATITVVDGSIELKDQLRDYKFRGEELTSMSFFDFILNTYEGLKEAEEDSRLVEDSANETPKYRGRGRPLNIRIAYQDEAGKGKCCRIRRSEELETLPIFIGKWFCRSDDNYERDLFRASMLMLLKPWRNLHELKSDTETFENAYDTLISQPNKKTHRVIANVQYYFECSDGAKAERKKAQMNFRADDTGAIGINSSELNIIIDDAEEIEGLYATMGSTLEDITEEDIQRAQLMKTHAREQLYGESAVALGYDIGFFEEAELSAAHTNAARKMLPEEAEHIRVWEAQLKATTRGQINRLGIINLTEEPGPSIGTREQEGETA